MSTKQVTVTVPATTANLGPGFDCLGLALGLYNEVRFTAVDQPGLTITVHDEGAEHIPTDETNLVYQAAAFTCQHLGHPLPGLHIRQQNNIPVGSGLGSSAAAVLSGVLGANALAGTPLTPSQVLQLAAAYEGHPDNVTPALYGGLTLTVPHEAGLHVAHLTVASLTVIIVLPAFELPTAQAREALPRHISVPDAVFNIGRMGLLIPALATADYPGLALAMQDKLHQPYRLPLIPGMVAAFAAAYTAGAAAVVLSGAGPSLAIFTSDHHETISRAVAGAFAEAGLTSRTWLLAIDRQGSVVT